MGPSHHMLKEKRVCEEGSWRAQIYSGLEPDLNNDDIVVGKHWNANSSSDTGLNYKLRQLDITKVVTAGMTCNQCLELTSHTAVELGYDITLTTNTTAGFTPEQKEVSQRLIWQVYFQKLTTVKKWAATLDETA